MMRSTPRSCSKVRMLRPSRPMILPFISSLGRATVETVCSWTSSCEYFEIAKAKMLRAFFSASSLASSSLVLM